MNFIKFLLILFCAVYKGELFTVFISCYFLSKVTFHEFVSDSHFHSWDASLASAAMQALKTRYWQLKCKYRILTLFWLIYRVLA